MKVKRKKTLTWEWVLHLKDYRVSEFCSSGSETRSGTESALRCRFDVVGRKYTASSEKMVIERMRWSAWWKRFILGSDLITCIQSSLQCPQPGSADATCLFFPPSLCLPFHNFFSISSTSLLWWCWDNILSQPKLLNWFIAIETLYNFVAWPSHI